METTARAPRDSAGSPKRSRGDRPELSGPTERRALRHASPPGMTWPPAMPFGEVLRRARAADEEAMTLLYRRFLPVVYRVVLARVADIPTAEDLTSETFFTVIERIGDTRAQDELTFAAWTLAIARNQVANYFRRQRTRPEARLDEPEQENLVAADDDPLIVITARERWSEVVMALNQLTEDQRNVLLYRVILGYSAEDVGALLEKQAGAVRALQFRALASLARILGLPAPRRLTGNGAVGE